MSAHVHGGSGAAARASARPAAGPTMCCDGPAALQANKKEDVSAYNEEERTMSIIASLLQHVTKQAWRCCVPRACSSRLSLKACPFCCDFAVAQGPRSCQVCGE